MAKTSIDPLKVLHAQVEHLPLVFGVSRVSDGVLVYANAILRALLHDDFGLEDAIGKSMIELGFFESDAQRLQMLEASRQPGGFSRRDVRDARGKVRADLAVFNVYAVDGVEYLTVVTLDVSSNLKTEMDLADTLERLQKAQAIAKIGDFMSELDSRELNGSAEAMRILGFDPERRTLSTHELFSHFHPDDRELIERTMSEQLPNGSFELEHRLHPDVDENRWVHTHCTVETLADGRSIMRGITQDITQRKREEEEKQRLDERIRETQKLESLGVLAGGIAHDFNNMLAGIMGNADFALLGDNVPANIQTRLREIVAASKRAGDLTRQLLAYSGQGHYVIEALDLSALIREMEQVLKVSVSTEHALRMNLSTNLPDVEADGSQIRQLVTSLVINASEAIDHTNGIVSITTGVQNCDGKFLASSNLTNEIEPGEYVFVEVSDNGTGMDEDTVASIFDPFFSTKFTGRGLGLAAGLGIARGHAGAIKVYSEPGRGTTFKVYLPVSAARVVTQLSPTR